MRFGYRIDLTDEPLLPRLPRKTRNIIRKAERTLQVRQGTLDELRNLHWNPIYLPSILKKTQQIYTSTHKGTITSAVLIEQKGEKAVYRFSGNHPDHTHLNGNTLLLYHAAKQLKTQGIKTLDLGGSKKKNIEDFKRRISTSHYPLKEPSLITIILKKIRYHLKKAEQLYAENLLEMQSYEF